VSPDAVVCRRIASDEGLATFVSDDEKVLIQVEADFVPPGTRQIVAVIRPMWLGEFAAKRS